MLWNASQRVGIIPYRLLSGNGRARDRPARTAHLLPQFVKPPVRFFQRR
jgi:hypothetical protein